jgi:hypothetical protein
MDRNKAFTLLGCLETGIYVAAAKWGFNCYGPAEVNRLLCNNLLNTASWKRTKNHATFDLCLIKIYGDVIFL